MVQEPHRLELQTTEAMVVPVVEGEVVVEHRGLAEAETPHLHLHLKETTVQRALSVTVEEEEVLVGQQVFVLLPKFLQTRQQPIVLSRVVRQF